MKTNGSIKHRPMKNAGPRPSPFLIVPIVLSAVLLSALSYACSDMINRLLRPGGDESIDFCILLDQSASIDAGVWSQAAAGLQSFLDSDIPESAAVGLQYFPVPPSGTIPTDCADCGLYGPCLPGFNVCAGSFAPDTSCDPEDYRTPAVGMAGIAAARQAIAASLAAKTPSGDATPTQPAFQGTVSYARDWLAAHPGRRLCIVLITDGEPTGCTYNSISGLVQAAQNAAGGDPAVAAYVIALNNSSPDLNQVAAAGGTGAAYAVDPAGNVSAQVLGFLRQMYADAAR